MALYLGLDSSTQSLTGIVLEVEGDSTRVVFESALAFDEAFPEYGTRHGVLPRSDPAVGVSSPPLWADALDAMMARVARSGLDIGRLRAVAGSAQQAGSVYMNSRGGPSALSRLDPGRPPGEQIVHALSRPVAPIWMDSSTRAECRELA